MEVGFYGKLPSHGDFLRRRASEDFVRTWDAWLQECLATSRAALGERWLDLYLTSPIWRFACAPGAAGAAAVAGVMAPSVDRVGRYFPITVVAELPSDVNVLSAAVDATDFFDAAEQAVVETLETEQVDLEVFDARIARLADLLQASRLAHPVRLDRSTTSLLGEDHPAGWQLPIGGLEHLPSVLVQLLSQRMAHLYAPLCTWWTEGSEAVEPSCLVRAGLPAPTSFGALLDGTWARHAWHVGPAAVPTRPGPFAAAATTPTPFYMRSGAATDVGRIRSVNQDAFLERPEAGLWVVADGLGGHTNGEVASRAVCDSLADLQPSASIEEMATGVARRLQDVNTHLLQTATRSLIADTCCSTVVVLVVRGSRLAVLWAGDSRVYRWRAGALEQLTTDHSVVPNGASRPESTIVTRAVGAEELLATDVVWGDVRPGDRYLLCSDGLTRTVSDGRLAETLGTGRLRDAVDSLLRESLAAGAPDNVTVLVAEATPETESLLGES